ncbi:MAG: wax ester/triacylglycerol synthase domain-containing protein, partial [Ilumatobacteraceae bacterium]
MTEPAQHDFASHLNASDALLWSMEKDPCLRSTIVAVSLLDRSPDWKRLHLRIAEACELIPRLRQHVVATPLRIGPPQWQLDEFFDIDFHLRRTIAPEVGDLRSVLDIAGLMAMSAFDKDRPLWEFTLVEGLTGGRAAFIQKVHHSITDGVGGVKLGQL